MLRLKPDLKGGERYEDRYGGWIKFFEQIATTSKYELVVCDDVPASWLPLLWYLHVDAFKPIRHFECDRFFDGVVPWEDYDEQLSRHELEVLCSFRPEVVDALWKVDAQWNCADGRVRELQRENQFLVTCNGSFWRPEVRSFIEAAKWFVPTQRNVVLVPCAADKPYPSPMHQAVLDRLPSDDWYIANVTGVLGIVPMQLWKYMPHYDSGIPNEWRAANIVRRYFQTNPHDRIVVYCDYYNESIDWALSGTPKVPVPEFVNEVRFYDDYLDLLQPARLRRLEAVLRSKP